MMSTPHRDMIPDAGEFLIGRGDDGAPQVQIRLVAGSVWMTQRQIAALFGVSIPAINEQLAAIYVEEEVDPARTIRQTRIVQTEGKRSVSRQVEQYDLPAIMAIGYRIHSAQGGLFREWATERLHESLLQGHVLSEEPRQSGSDGSQVATTVR